MDDNASKIYLLDGMEYEASTAEQQNLLPGRAVYEVMRVIKGVPLFYQDHYERMKNSLAAIDRPLLMTSDELKNDIKKLLKLNNLISCNVKTVLYDDGNSQSRVVYISKSYYPTEEEADAGTKTGIFQLERQNPNAKIVNKAYKDSVNKKMQEGGFFEVILVDNSGRITEGSRSNAFFVMGNIIFTAPGEFVLKGITRKYVFEACRNAGFEVKEEFIAANEVGRLDGAFLSGTSIKVLPIASIDNIVLNSSQNPVVAAVRREYNLIIDKYVDKNVNIW